MGLLRHSFASSKSPSQGRCCEYGLPLPCNEQTNYTVSFADLDVDSYAAKVMQSSIQTSTLVATSPTSLASPISPPFSPIVASEDGSGQERHYKELQRALEEKGKPIKYRWNVLISLDGVINELKKHIEMMASHRPSLVTNLNSPPPPTFDATNLSRLSLDKLGRLSFTRKSATLIASNKPVLLGMASMRNSPKSAEALNWTTGQSNKSASHLTSTKCTIDNVDYDEPLSSEKKTFGRSKGLLSRSLSLVPLTNLFRKIRTGSQTQQSPIRPVFTKPCISEGKVGALGDKHKKDPDPIALHKEHEICRRSPYRHMNEACDCFHPPLQRGKYIAIGLEEWTPMYSHEQLASGLVPNPERLDVERLEMYLDEPSWLDVFGVPPMWAGALSGPHFIEKKRRFGLTKSQFLMQIRILKELEEQTGLPVDPITANKFMTR